jgi:hypothetical protein
MEEELERARKEAEQVLNQQRTGYEGKLADLEKTLVCLAWLSSSLSLSGQFKSNFIPLTAGIIVIIVTIINVIIVVVVITINVITVSPSSPSMSSLSS